MNATIVHLTASPFFGGPERQMLGLATHLDRRFRSVFLSYEERGLAFPFVQRLQAAGVQTLFLKSNTPHLFRSAKEVARLLRRLGADALCCHGYKPDIVGYLAARRSGVPVVSISRGWTAATRKVRLYESIDRLLLPHMDRVICVSDGQAQKVIRAGTQPSRITVIRNAIQTERFDHPDLRYREHLADFFPSKPSRIVLAAGRLSPEKGFDQMVAAAAIVAQSDPSIGFVVLGDGPLRLALERQIADADLRGRFILAGFRDDVDRFLPHADAVMIPSFTEGLPNIALEACAASVPMVATSVGGIPEVVLDGINGFLVPPGRPAALAERLLKLLGDENRRQAMGQAGRRHVLDHFTFDAQARAYERFFEDLLHRADAPLKHAVA